MSWRVIKQPNGLLGIFSDVVDHFTYYDMTEEEAIEVCQSDYDLGRLASRDKVQAGLDDIKPYTMDKGSGLERWADALDRIKSVYGVKEMNKFKKEIECQK